VERKFSADERLGGDVSDAHDGTLAVSWEEQETGEAFKLIFDGMDGHIKSPRKRLHWCAPEKHRDFSRQPAEFFTSTSGAIHQPNGEPSKPLLTGACRHDFPLADSFEASRMRSG
jgi:hypothetical protein